MTNDEIITKFANEDRLADPDDNDAFNEMIRALMDEARSEALADFCKELDKYIESKAGMGGHGEDSYLYMDFDVYLALKQAKGIE